jgi:cytochrome P450
VVIDIYDPSGYVAGPPHDALTHLRRTKPVFWQDMPDGTGYWAVLRHADVVEVARQPTRFSAAEGGVVLEDLAPDQLAMMRNMLLAMDPPRHVAYRREVFPSFRAQIIADLEGRIREICGQIMAAAAAQGDVEFVHDVTSSLPTQVIGQLMGLPREDWVQVHRWAEQNNSGQDPDTVVEADGFASAAMAMATYGMEWAIRRRAEEARNDLTSLILAAEVDGQPMTEWEFGSFFVQLVTAGNDTTKTMLSNGLLALLEHPEQLAELRADPTLIPGAVDEILRWANPLHYFRRTCTEDSELGGQQIGAGQKLAMVYTSANRDEAVFANSQAFDIHRNPNPHLSFGIAEHFCLGVHLARLEGRVFFEELLAAFSRIELIGQPKRLRSNLNNALKSLPVRLTR